MRVREQWRPPGGSLFRPERPEWSRPASDPATKSPQRQKEEINDLKSVQPPDSTTESPQGQKEEINTTMSWEYRGKQGPYYTRTRSINGRIVREYIGAGLSGRLAAAEDEERRR